MTVFVVEFKVGAREFDSTSRWQVTSYARDLQDFHAESHSRSIVPILCATDARVGLTDLGELIYSTGDSWHLGQDERCQQLEDSCLRADSECSQPELFLATNLDEYRHRWLTFSLPSLRPRLSRLQPYYTKAMTCVSCITDMRTTWIRQRTCFSAKWMKPQRYGRRTICFCYRYSGSRQDTNGLKRCPQQGSAEYIETFIWIFLSGNGPLVKVVR